MWPHGYEVIIGRKVWRNSEGGSQFANGPGLRVRVNLVKSAAKKLGMRHIRQIRVAQVIFCIATNLVLTLSQISRLKENTKKVEFSFPTAGRRWVGNISGNLSHRGERMN